MCGLLLIGRLACDNLMVVKAIFLALVLLAFALCSTDCLAEDWTTTDGTKYQNVEVIRVEDDAVTILYKDGGALVPLFKLSPALQERFDYDPVKAKAAAEARAKADAENAKELQAEIALADKMKRDQAIKDAEARGQTNAP
jgi:hypothetical protein